MENSDFFDIQRKIVANMTSESWRTIPHVAFSYEPDITSFERHYAEAFKPLGVSFNTMILSVIANALKAAPSMNAHFSFNRWTVTGRLDVRESVDISMPAGLPDGRMMTLNIHDCASLTPVQLQARIGDTMRRAAASNLDEVMMSTAMHDTVSAALHGHLWKALGRMVGRLMNPRCAALLHGKERKEYYKRPLTERLGVADIEQGSITVSNFGSLHRGLRGAPLLLEVVPPQVVAIGIGAIQDAGGRRILPLCIAFDHRALDFGDIVPFIKALDAVFESV